MGKKDRGGAGGRRNKYDSDEESVAVKPGRTHNRRAEKQEFAKKRRKERSLMWNKDDMTILAPQLDKLGLFVKEIVGDGNCLFRSVSDQLYGNEGRHHEFRAMAVEWMRAHPDDFAPFLLEEEGHETLDSYLASMERDAEWGGNLEALALAQALQMNVIFHQADQRPWSIAQHKGGAEVPALHLSYHDGQHYNSVRAPFDLTSKSALALKLNAADGCYEPSDGRTTVFDVASRSWGGALCTRTDFGDAKRPKVAAAAASSAATPADEGKPEGEPAAASADVGGGAKEEAPAAGKPSSSASGATAAPRRNGPCYCGSGKAYRKCCQDADLALQRKMAVLKLKEAEKEASKDEDAGKKTKRGGREKKKGADSSDDEEGKGEKKAFSQQEAATPIMI